MSQSAKSCAVAFPRQRNNATSQRCATNNATETEEKSHKPASIRELRAQLRAQQQCNCLEPEKIVVAHRMPLGKEATVKLPLSEVSAKPDKEKLLEQLRQFELGRVDEYPEDKAVITRVNNMAWEFMQTDGMTFKEAITLAAEIVVNTQVSACEAAYEDVQALWWRVSK